MLDVAIVGGGIQGVHMAHVLKSGVGVHRNRMTVIDPHPSLAMRWTVRTSRVGFDHLRSTLVHHVGLAAGDLANAGMASKAQDFAPPYQQPSLRLFNAHVRSTIEQSELDACHCVAAALQVRRHQAAFRIETSRGPLEARRVILALGPAEPAIPAWARDPALSARVDHVFNPTIPDHLLRPPREGERVLIVGGGMTAVQLSLRMARHAPSAVTLVSHRSPPVKQFDSDAGWMGPRFLDDFGRLASPRERRIRISTGRNRGSITAAVAKALRSAVAAQVLVHRVGNVQSAEPCADGVMVRFENGNDTLTADRIILATGFGNVRPGGVLLDDLIRCYQLPIAACGYPLVNDELEWAPRLHVMGNLAELKLGPAAANLPGARMAASAIASALVS